MKRVRFKLLVLFLCLILMFGSVPVWAVSGNTDYVTREQAVVALLNTIGTGALNETESDLNVFIDANEITPESVDELGIAVTNGILAGTAEKALKPKNNITRLEFAMLVSRAIRELPFINESQDFSDISGNAEQDVNKLVRAGLMFGYGNDKFGPDDFLTSEQLKAIINRIANLSEIKAQDDFYYAVNYDWLVNTKLPAGYPSLTTFDEVNLNNKKRLDSIVGELIENSEKYQKGTVEQKMSDFYSTIIDIENRNKEGIEPIRPYLERIDSVKTLQEFIDLVVEFENKEGFNPIFTFVPSADLKDSTRYMLYGKGLSTALPSHYYINENPQIMALYEGFIAQMFMFSGINQEEAMLYAQQIYNFEKVIAQNTMSNEDASKIENIYNPIDADELAEMFENIDIKKFINDLDYKGVETVIVLDPGLMRKTGELIAEENIEILKIFSKYNIIVSAAPYLSKELEDAVYAFNNTFLGVSTSLSDSDKAFYLLNSVMGSYLGKMYVEKYFSEDAKKDVENMVKEIIETYRNRIEKLDWMAEETKNAAVSKLNAITLKIGYPEKWNDQLEGIEIKNYEDGGSLFGNILSIQKAQNKYLKTILSEPVDKSGWLVPPHTVNAYHNMTSNEIVFPAGILQYPFYDLEASREQNLGGIGFIIAHEITHAFDNNGAQFDENGNMKNWWTQQDYSAFQQKCQEVINLFDGLEIAPGAVVNGTLTVSENVADIGAMACILDIAGNMQDVNYKELFESYARIWCLTGTKQVYQILTVQDVHSPNKFRVNQVIRNFQEFYDTYDVSQENKMYLAPQNRITIW